jgi:hypothetical protein
MYPHALAAMMDSIYAAQEQRWADESEQAQQEYDIALRRKPGPIQWDDVVRYMGRASYDAERVGAARAALRAGE